VTLEEHHGDVVLRIELGQAGNGLTKEAVELALVVGHPKELQTGDVELTGIKGIEDCLGGRVDLGMGVIVDLEPLAGDSVNALHGGHLHQPGPMDTVGELGIGLFANAEPDEHEQRALGFIHRKVERVEKGKEG